ncbi:MAG: hypothetical protein ACO3K7_01005 [Candidatus Marinamargulisbacteria bacterium]
MSANVSNDDSRQFLADNLRLMTIKCQELPDDISYWVGVANQSSATSQAFESVMVASVTPRKRYLDELTRLQRGITDILDIYSTPMNQDAPEISSEMPIETIVRKYMKFNQWVTEIDQKDRAITSVFIDVDECIEFIRNKLSQPVLSCSKGSVSFKDIQYHVSKIQSDTVTMIQKAHEKSKKGLSILTDQLLQKIESDVASQQTITDRHTMHQQLQVYLGTIESNHDFHRLMPSLQETIRQTIYRPLSVMSTQQQASITLARDELKQLKAPFDSRSLTDCSGMAVHQLIQNAVDQAHELNRLKSNMMGAFTNMVTQMSHLFNAQMSTPIHAATLVGTAFLENPLTSESCVNDFKEQLSVIQSSDTYKALKHTAGSEHLSESFDFLEAKMTHLAESLSIRDDLTMSVVADSSSNNKIISPLSDVSDDHRLERIRKTLVTRYQHATRVSTQIKCLLQCVTAQVIWTYYQQSIQSDICVKNRIQAIVSNLSTDFYDQYNQEFNLRKSVFIATVNTIIHNRCYLEMEKNRRLFYAKSQVSTLYKQCQNARGQYRHTLRHHLNQKRFAWQQMVLSIAISRLRELISIISQVDGWPPNNSDALTLSQLKIELSERIHQQQVFDQLTTKKFTNR